MLQNSKDFQRHLTQRLIIMDGFLAIYADTTSGIIRDL